MEQNFLKTAGIADGDVVLSDGSGLSRDDLVTPRAIVQLLLYVSQQPWGVDYISTFPIAGVDGTLENRMKDTAASGRILAKTGSLEHVRAMSGYATTAVSYTHLDVYKRQATKQSARCFPVTLAFPIPLP